jgi:hypothetical protein
MAQRKQPMARFMAFVVVNEKTGCWEWTGYRDKRGYGKFHASGKNHYAHKWLWEQFNGKVPADKELDPLCQNTSCVNLDTLEPVTHTENIRRGKAADAHRNKTHCPQGHPYAGDNLYTFPDGRRVCKICRRVSGRKHDHIKRMEGTVSN